VVPLIAPDGSEGQKLELLSDGQQLACFGIHPDTRKPYTWLGGEPGAIKRQDLPLITEAEARQLVNDAVEILCRDFGYRLAPKRPDRTVNDGPGAADWSFLMENIRLGRDLHDSTRDLAAKLVVAGLNGGVAVNVLRAVMDQSKAKQDTPKRWQERYDEIPRLVTSAEEKFAPGSRHGEFSQQHEKESASRCRASDNKARRGGR
jgi:hypothetical protein